MSFSSSCSSSSSDSTLGMAASSSAKFCVWPRERACRSKTRAHENRSARKAREMQLFETEEERTHACTESSLRSSGARGDPRAECERRRVEQTNVSDLQ